MGILVYIGLLVVHNDTRASIPLHDSEMDFMSCWPGAFSGDATLSQRNGICKEANSWCASLEALLSAMTLP